MDIKDEEKRLSLENKKLAREVRRLTQEITLLRTTNEQSIYTQAYIQRETDRQMFFIEQLARTSPNIFVLTDDQLRTVMTSDLLFQYNTACDKDAIRRGIPLQDALTGVLPESELEHFMEKCREVLKGKTVKRFILRGTRMEGRQRWRCNIRRMSRNDEIVGLNVLFSDTTDMLDALDRAESADKAKSSFLAQMSHEIRTPINAILGLNEVILRESTDQETIAYASDIQNAGRTLLSLINDILDFSKVEEGKMEILPAKYELGSVINDLVNMIRMRAEKKKLHFSVSVDENTPHLLFGDEIRIRQCALNILTNAVKYTDKGSVKLTIGYEDVSDDKILLKFTVADTGLGIKPEDLKRLTTPFSRLDEARIRAVEGTGLGLAITKQLLGLMGSTLEVKSEYGSGSEFSFAIEQPVVDRWPVGEFSSRIAETGAHRAAGSVSFCAPEARVLIVDDMPVNLTVVKGLLKKTRLQIDTAGSGREALDLASQKTYDVAFIDHMMPEMDGIETLRRLKRRPQTAGTVFIALTANAISGSREKYLEAGFEDYLSKPVDGERLEEMLLKYLPSEKVSMEMELPVPIESDAAQLQLSEFDGAAPPALPEELYRIGELDVARGVKACGSAETYLETASIYAQTAADCADEIAGYRRLGDLEDVITKVHAIKSTSRVIGAESLGALAEHLELAGKAGDTETLLGGLDELLARYRALGGALLPLVGPKKEPEAELAPMSEPELRELYGKLRAQVEAFDYGPAAALIDFLAGYRLPEGEQARFDKLKHAADNFDWDLIPELLS